MQKGIKFWSYLYRLFVKGFVLHSVGEPMIISLESNLVFFEIPQISNEGQPLKFLGQFPIPISGNKFSLSGDFFDDKYLNAEKYFAPVQIGKTILENNKFESNKCNDYYLYGISSVVSELKKQPQQEINNLKVYIELIYMIFFNINDESLIPKISFRKLSYIEKYLHKYTKLYINYINELDQDENSDEIELNQNYFIAFFYLLTISSFYAYNYLPENKMNNEKKFIGHGLIFLTVNNIFSDQISNDQKKINFYITKSQDKLFEHLNKIVFNAKNKYFNAFFNYKDSDQNPQDVVRNIFCSSNDYKEKIVKPFIKKNPNSYISRTQMTIQTLFRSSILINRIFLTQPIILSGDTGWGKTSSLMQLFEYIRLPINNEMYSLNIEVGSTLNCHGGITIDDVINHLKNITKSSKKHIVFFDELNTSPASSFIEHLLLNDKDKYHSKFVFIGALNPFVKKNPISANLTKVGLEQIIKGEKKNISIIEDASKIADDELNNMSDMMYYVHPSQQGAQDIVFDFNPICYENEFNEKDKFYLNEEKTSIHLIIDNIAKYPKNNIISPKDTRKIILDDLKKNIDTCIVFIRRLMNERAVISYRDIERTMAIYNKLFEYYNDNENKVNNKDIPLVTVIVSFVLRLPNNQEFDVKDLGTNELKSTFESVFKEYFGNENEKYGSCKDGKYKINIRDKLLSLLNPDIEQTMEKFMAFVYQYTIQYLKIQTIWKFQSTFIHFFIMDICIKCKLPCFVIGMPGTSKSYAVELLKEVNGDNLYISTYMSSRTSSPDGIKSQFYDATFKEICNQLDDIKDRYCAVFIDEMGNANINPSRPLKFLHGILDHGLVLNETGYSNKVATIGVSNYTMDFANMNRGVLVYTGLPDLAEILTVFAIDSDPNQFNYTKSASDFIEYRKSINKENIKQVFQNLWPNGMPETIALRSIYNIRFLIDNTKFNVHSVCRILRELFNSKRLAKSRNHTYKKLISELPSNVKKDIFKQFDNLACFIERVACNDTQSNKSLSIFTKNYEAIEYFELFLDDEFISFIQRKFKIDESPAFTIENGAFKNFVYHLFAENFKRCPDEISQDALEKIIECISSVKHNLLFIGNHPCFDSCLDLLNVPHKSVERDVILGSGFSSKFRLTI